MNSSESFSTASNYRTSADINSTNPQLLDLNEVLESRNTELLAQQLKAAHQLLAYQNEVVHSLTEQLHLRETSLIQVQEEACNLQHQCDAQQLEVSELQSINADLRSLLKRQQRRTAVRQVVQPNWQRGSHVFDVAVQSFSNAEDISLGYESHCEPMMVASNTKAPPVKAWSANQSTVLHEEVTFCQKLTTFIVASSTRVSQFSQESASKYVQSHQPSRLSDSTGVELPAFAVG